MRDAPMSFSMLSKLATMPTTHLLVKHWLASPSYQADACTAYVSVRVNGHRGHFGLVEKLKVLFTGAFAYNP